MSSLPPFFSIIIPTYNRALLTKQAIESALAQDFGNFEVIIVDDGSTDTTNQVLAEFSGKITVITQNNSGPERARNAGVSMANGRYFVFLDSDDVLHRSALSVYYHIITSNPAAIIIAQGAGFRDECDRMKPLLHTSPEYSIYKDYLAKKKGVWLSSSFLVISRYHWQANKSFFRSGTYPLDDLDFLLRFGTQGPCIIIKHPITVGYRIHSSNSVLDIKKNMAQLQAIMTMEHNGEYPGGFRRKFDRLALIGGHIQCWTKKGIQSGFFKESAMLTIMGFWPLWAIGLKKMAIGVLNVTNAVLTIAAKLRNGSVHSPA